jgi:hypothetical protein
METRRLGMIERKEGKARKVEESDAAPPSEEKRI